MSGEPTTVAKLRGLPWSIACNSANQVFSQFTFFGAVFILFLNQLGLSKTEIGFILALVPFSAVLAPMIAPFAARHGYKRVFVWFYAARKTVTLLILPAPWVAAWGGASALFWYIAAVVAIFATVRTIEETAYFPWVQEFVPNSVRGKYSAMSNIFTALVGFVSVWVAGRVLDGADGLSGFMWLFAVGAGFGYLSVWFSTLIPGGARQPEPPPRALGIALRDRDMRGYLVGVALIVLGTAPLGTFLPLYMEEEVGLSSASVVQLQMGSLLGMLIFSYLWGWAADRYGSKPVMQIGGWLLVLMPVLWWLVPHGSPWSLWAALTVAFIQGVASLGWGIGAGRLLYVSIVPPTHKLDYMAVYFAWVGIIGGISQFAGGGVLDAARGLSGEFFGIQLNAYVPLFVAAGLLPLAAILFFRRVQGDSPLSTGQFAAIFLRGNPIMAMGSLIRFHYAKDEDSTVALTAELAATGSRLTVDELLEALADPRFNVRFEAILAMARMPADPRLTAALVRTLQSKSPALSSMAAWALGRGGHRDALDALRDSLDAGYRSVQGYSARALGTLGDKTAAEGLLARLADTEDEGLGLAYAAALGRLGAVEALPLLLTRLETATDDAVRMELALAVARLVGDERPYLQMARAAASQPGTAYAQALNAAAKHLTRVARRQPDKRASDPAVAATLLELEEAFARDEVDAAAIALADWVLGWQTSAAGRRLNPAATQVLTVAVGQLGTHRAARPEYILLTLHALTVG